ncbi:hypothetical protein ACQKKK_05715 [Peribacillus sp. NPDC006672]
MDISWNDKEVFIRKARKNGTVIKLVKLLVSEMILLHSKVKRWKANVD